ncbi:MAG: hypothetical protein KatS3mg015_0807 [Fimbriimonadales bacterium]|nr:MAG: hypothetical protein KatS3mg015_0807 [Fimbriimonadales bacterium]
MKRRLFAGTTILGLLVAFAVAIAQGGDSPTHRGQPSRVGRNVDPLEPGPGVANLRWWFPLQRDVGADVTGDNAGPTYSETGTWATPAPLEESGDWFGAPGNPYRYAFVVPSNLGDQTSGATATATWTLQQTDGIQPNQVYALNVWFPSSGTMPGGILSPNSEFAVYKIEYDFDGVNYQREFIDIVPHLGGGNWVRLGRQLGTDDRIFPSGTGGSIRITLYNTVPRDDDGNLMGPTNNRIVTADAVLAVPSPGNIFASPVVKRIGPGPSDTLVVVARNQASVDPTDPDGLREVTSGTVHAIEASGPNISLERWRWSPSLVTNKNIVVDNTNPLFSADSAWVQPNPMAPGFFGSNYLAAPVDLTYPGSARATWAPDLGANVNTFDIWVWFPGSDATNLHARAARYVVREGAQQFEFFVNQDVGGRWVRIGNRPFTHDPANGGLRLEVWNYSNDPADAGRVVVADAAMFVGQTSGSIYSTPTIAQVNIRKSNNVVEPTECVFVAAEDGRIYCLDAAGDGNGGTIVYWAYPSIPDTNDPNWSDPNDSIDGPEGNRIPWPTDFGVSSMFVQNIGGKDLLFIAAQNGRIYAIDCIGRGDYDSTTQKPGTTMREWTWPKAKYNSGTNSLEVDPARGPFTASVAYDAVNNQVIAAGIEGRIFALDAPGNGDQTTNLNWAWPDFNDPPVGSISGTPAVGGGKVYVTSFDGHVYARDLTGDQNPALNWQFPDVSQPALDPFSFTGVCYVPGAQVGFLQDLVYFINDNGHFYACQANDGTLVFDSNDVPGGASSSPYFTQIVPSGFALPEPMITVATNDGAFLGLYADPARTNSAGGRLAWGWQSRGSSAFASPAVAYGWMYHAGEDGYLYAFSTGGLISNDTLPPPGGQIDTPDSGGNNYTDLKYKFISQADYVQLRQTPPAVDPSAVADIYAPNTPTLEWGEQLYIVAYDFPYQPTDTIQIRFQLRGPGGMNITQDRTPVVDPFNPGRGLAVARIPFIGSGPNFLTPGERLNFDVSVIDNNRVTPTPAPARDMTVLNPLAVTTVNQIVGVPPAGKSVGWSPDPNFTFGGTFENHINGSNNKRILSSAGQVGHGSSERQTFFVSDRSRIVDLVGGGLSQVKMTRTDAFWRGGAAAVIKPMPFAGWEVMPTERPNLSPDYPDIDRSDIGLIADPFGQAVDPTVDRAGVRLSPPSNYDPNNPLTRILEPVRFDFSFSPPRYQPANLTPFVDAAGETLDGGYVARAIVYVDSNGNGRADGIEDSLTDLPPRPRREAFRSLRVGGSVPVDESISIAEETVDLGSEPHSLGYTPMPPWTLNGFDPWSTGTFRLFFKTFTVRNEGNVNMLDLRVATRVGFLPGPVYQPVAFLSDANDSQAWLDGFPNIITNLNPPYSNPPFVPPTGANDANGNQRVTLHKARAGDRAPTVLSIPDVPYGATPPPGSEPRIGVAVPLGFPAGEYSQLVFVIEDNFLVGGGNDMAALVDQNGQPLEAFSDPTMRVKLRIRETRVTGGQTTGSVPHVDPDLGVSTAFRWTNTMPTAFRDVTGGMHLLWLSNRPGQANTPASPQAQDVWRLFAAVLRGTTPAGAPPEAGTSPLRDLLGFPSLGSSFYLKFLGPAPTLPPNTLFDQTPGVVVGSPQFGGPAFPVNFDTIGLTANPQEEFGLPGSAFKDANGDGQADYIDHRIFYATYEVSPSTPVPNVRDWAWISVDPELEKQHLRTLRTLDANRLAFFWHANVNGHPKMFQNVRVNRPGNASGNQTANWTDNLLIDPGPGFAAAMEPTPWLRSNGDIDIVFTGRLRDRAQPEVFYGRWDGDNLLRVRGLRDMPERNREVLVRDAATGRYRARGVNWNLRRPLELWVRYPNQAATRLDIAGTRNFDEATGLVTMDSRTGGKIYFDPHTGTVWFSTSPPSAAGRLELRYTPRIIRVSELGDTGGHSNPSAFLDNRNASVREFWSRVSGNGAFTPLQANDAPRVGRYWYFYERGATGQGQQHRPYMKTQRLTVQLRFPIALDNNGNPRVLSVRKANGSPLDGPFYQADPGNGRIFFTLPDEGNEVEVTYQYRDNNGVLQTDVVTAFVDWQTEMAEQPVPIEQAIDEGSLYAFPDTFDPSPVSGELRPPLVWVFFTSTRGGTPDVYYVTVAPRIEPVRFRN